MALQLIKIETIEVASPVASITFSNIPQGYTDLKVVISSRVIDSGGPFGSNGYLNSYGTSYTSRQLIGDGTNAFSQSYSFGVFLFGYTPGASETTNTFNNTELYFSDYTSSKHKTISVDNVSENNATTGYSGIITNLYPSTSPITSMVLAPSSGSLAAGTTYTLYGVI
jgi:hypothetical protein